MPEAMSGKLDQLSLTDLLSMLSSGRKTGCLHIKNGVKQGDIFFEEGQAVHASAGPLKGEAALLLVTSWLKGDFAFESDVAPPDTTIAVPMDAMISSVDETLQEYRAIRALIPHNDLAFRFSTDTASDDVSLRPQEWRILSQIDGNRTVEELAATVGMDTFNTLKILSHFVQAGLIQVSEQKEQVDSKNIGVEFFDKLNAELIELIGPIGPIIIEDELQSMGLSMDNFPRSRVAELVERASESIEDETKRIHFQRIMLALLKEV